MVGTAHGSRERLMTETTGAASCRSTERSDASCAETRLKRGCISIQSFGGRPALALAD